jgi:hypothetical protein
MKCLVCNNYFNERRNLTTLFDTKKYYICNQCIKRHPLELEFNIIPLDYHNLEIVSLFKKNKRINYDGFVKEFSTIYENLVNTKKNSLVIFCDFFYLNDEKIEEFNFISTLLDKDILILTNLLFL